MVRSGTSREAWLQVSRAILERGAAAAYEGESSWIPHGALELGVYAHSLDFGKKAYGNLVELARLQERVAGAVGVGVGRLVVQVKSAHVYEPEWALMSRLAGAALPVA